MDDKVLTTLLPSSAVQPAFIVGQDKPETSSNLIFTVTMASSIKPQRTVNKVPDVGISRGKAMTGLGSPHLDIGESARISIFNSPFSDSIKLDFKEMLKI